MSWEDKHEQINNRREVNKLEGTRTSYDLRKCSGHLRNIHALAHLLPYIITLGFHVVLPSGFKIWCFQIYQESLWQFSKLFSVIHGKKKKNKVWPHNKYAFILTIFINMYPCSAPLLCAVYSGILLYFESASFDSWNWLTGCDTQFEERLVWLFW